MIKDFKAGQLSVSIYESRTELGEAAAGYVAERIKKAAERKDKVRVVFAAAVSQTEFLQEFLKRDDVPWEKVVGFHMDEYHTLPANAPQRFGNFLKKHLFSHRPFGKVHYMANNMESYVALIEEAPIDIVCMGIGENGHLAFNDPPVANFNDPKTVKEVILDQVCRQQQVNDGEFERIEDVPETAVTLTLPTLMKAEFLSIVVPGPTKAEAVKKTLFGEISTSCPSTILRIHPNAKLFLDIHSAKNIQEKTS